MYKYLLEQEHILLNALKNETDLERFYEYSKTQIAWICHERFIHLLVTFFFGSLVLVSFAGALLLQLKSLYILFVLLTVLVVFYIIHYYRLENGVQRLYRIANSIYEKI